MILSFVMSYNIGQSQDHGGFQQYYYSGDGASSIVPKIYYQSRKNWYGELRYNYEESQTVSLNVGKMFSNKGLFSYSITPVAGVVAGKLNGISVGTNVEVDYKKLFFSSESQYTFSIEESTQDLFFNWSEYGYQITKPVYAGIALQVTRHYSLKNIWEPGIMIGWIYKSWSFPVYVFNPFWGNPNFVAGINWEWAHADHKKN